MLDPYEPAGWTERFPAPRPRQRVRLHVLLLLLTVLSTIAGGSGFTEALSLTLSPGLAWQHADWMGGLAYSATALSILGAHELGHYFACRYYQVDATWPFFLPSPFLFGTLGAFIKIREPIRSKRVLFDVGVGGPLAGFVVAVPALFLGVALSRVVPTPAQFVGIELGEPLLFKAASWVWWGPLADNQTLMAHPVALAAWFGLLATSLNLFPIGQLDGGHISYAVFGRRSLYITLAAVAGAIVLTQFSASWYVWTAMIVTMLFIIGPRHPSVPDEHVPLDRRRLVVALLALVIFVLCFTPTPIEFVELLPK